jgi:hypothetical protein
MHIRFTCPECREKIELSDYLAGLHTLCPHCKTRILAPDPSRPQEQITAAPPPLPAPRAEPPPPVSDKLTAAAPPSGLSGMPRYADDAETPRGFFPPDQYAPALPGGSGEGWAPVRVGLLLLQIGLGLFVAAIAVYLIAAAGLCMVGAGGLRPGQELPQGSGIFAALGGVLFAFGLVLLGSLVFLVGQAMCCAAPGRSGVRGLIIAALVCSLAGHAASVGGGLAQVSGNARRQVQQEQPDLDWSRGLPGRGAGEGTNLAAAAFSLSGALLGLVSHFLLAGFLQGVGHYFGDMAVIDRAADYFKNLITFIGLVLGLLVFSCVPVLGLLAGIGLLGVLFIYGIILFVKFFNLIAETRRTVTNALARV